MIVLRSGRYTRKPSLGATVDYSHPLANGLVECVLLNEGGGPPRSLITRDVAAPTSNPSWAAGRAGVGRVYSGGSRDAFTDRAAHSITGAVTVAAGVLNAEANGTDSWHTLVSRRASTGNSAVEFALNFNSAFAVGRGIQFFWNTGGAYQVIGIGNNGGNSAGPYQGIPTSLIGTRSSGNVGKIYKDGVLGNTSGALSTAGAGTTPLTLGACGDGSEPFDGSLYYAYVWNRELSADEVALVAREPYGHIAVRPYRRYFLMTVAPPGGVIPVFAHHYRQQGIQ